VAADMENIDVKITFEELILADCQDFIASDSTGGLVHFVGTVRNQTKGKKVLFLDFESYEPMALKEMRKIAEEAIKQFNVDKIAIYHRLGKLNIGEIPVIIGVSAAHRISAFMACQYAIDTLKNTVPIWKKEHFEDGEVWVSATP
jgi:molybdopterin synthase catalytic subunit